MPTPTKWPSYTAPAKASGWWPRAFPGARGTTWLRSTTSFPRINTRGSTWSRGAWRPVACRWTTAAASISNLLEDACDERTRLVSVSWVGYASGWRCDLDAVAELAHRRGALLFVDAIQGLGVFPLDVQATPVDFLAADGHKWMLGPEGAGLFYLRREHLDRLRPIGVGWHSVVHAADYNRIELELKPSAARYEGGSQNMVGFIGLAESLELLLEFGHAGDRRADSANHRSGLPTSGAGRRTNCTRPARATTARASSRSNSLARTRWRSSSACSRPASSPAPEAASSAWQPTPTTTPKTSSGWSRRCKAPHSSARHLRAWRAAGSFWYASKANAFHAC